MPKRRLTHILWLIEHHPESELVLEEHARLSPGPNVLNTPADFERVKALWLAQAASRGQNPRVLAHAADYLWEADPFLAEDLFKRARQLEPSEALWTNRLAERLIRVIYNSAPPPPGAEPNRWSNPTFAAAVKNELETSEDVALVGAVGDHLAWTAQPPKSEPNQVMESWLRENAKARGDYAETLLKRAQSLEPGNRRWTEALERLHLLRDGKGEELVGRKEAGVKIRVGTAVQDSNLIRHIPPEYPALAQQARIQGVVRLRIAINKDGHVSKMETVSGHPLLVSAARKAVEQWVYQPTLLNGSPIEVVTDIEVPFVLGERN